MATTKRIIPRQFNGADYDTIEYQTVANAVKTQAGSLDADLQAHVDNATRHITGAERTSWNGKQSATPNGTDPLISASDGKINSAYIPDIIMGQILYGGIIAQNGVATLSDAFKTKYDVSTNTLQILAEDAPEYSGTYFIAQDSTVFSNVTIIGVAAVSTGDWIVSNGSSGWAKIDNTDAVTSVAGKTGAVVLVKDDVGLGNVDNTSDLNKPVSTATQTQLDGKATVAALNSETSRAMAAEATKLGTTEQAADSAKLGGQLPSYFATAAQGDKADTAYQKPVTGIPKTDLDAAVQASLNYADSALQGVPDAATAVKGVATLGAAGGAARYGQKADAGLANVDNTSDANKPVSTAQASAINARAKITVSATQPVGAVTNDFWFQVV